MTVRHRLLLTLAGVILLLMVPAVYGVSQLERLRDVAIDLEDIHAADISAIGEYRAALSELDRNQRSFIATADEGFLSEIHRQLDRARRELGRVGDGLEEELAPTVQILDSLTVASTRIEDLVRAGEVEEATLYFEGVKPLLDSARQTVRRVTAAIDERGRMRVAEARRVSASAARTTVLTLAIAALLTVILGLWTTDALSQPIRRLSDAHRIVADGQFEAPDDLPYSRTDEIGELSRSFASMTERLAELDRLKAEFVGLATHELKTPINVIGGYSELMEEGIYGETNEKQREVLGHIQDQTRSLTRLVNQLLDLSRLEAGGLQIEPAPVSLEQLFRDVEGSFQALAMQKEIDFEVTRDPDLPATAMLDYDRVRHEVLSNLLSNAFKFTDRGGRIALEATREDDSLQMIVRDTGVGIPPDQLEHIFEKYYQVEGEAKAQGSGLGLAIAKHVVVAHGGSIQAASVAGDGTVFDIRIPVEGSGA
jgi:signal transduction histidine kinase